MLDFQTEISLQNKEIENFNIDKNELEFLKLNLEHGHKCRKTILKNTGFKVGTAEYKNCVLKKGRKN